MVALLVLLQPHPQAGEVRGHITILEKDNRPSSDLGDAVVYLDGGAPAPPRSQSFEIATSDKAFVPHVAAVPLGSTVRFVNHDPFDHNVFSVSEPNQFDLGRYGRGLAKSHAAAEGSFAIAGVTPGRYTVHVWHERSPEVAREVTVGANGVSDVAIELDARGFRWIPHKNKHGQDYPTNAGRERY